MCIERLKQPSSEEWHIAMCRYLVVSALQLKIIHYFGDRKEMAQLRDYPTVEPF
jgi:hypothetical protein